MRFFSCPRSLLLAHILHPAPKPLHTLGGRDFARPVPPPTRELVLSQSLIRGVIQRLRILEPADISLLLYIAASISAWIGYNALSDAGLVDIFVRHYFVLIHFSLTLTYICKDANFDLTNIGAKSQFPSSLLDPLMSSANTYRHL